MNFTFSRNGLIAFRIGFQKVLPFAALMLLPVMAASQDTPRGALTPGGGNSAGARASLSWTLGDLSAGYYLTPRMQYREGFQSAPLRVTSVESLPTAWKIDIYPNPAQTRLSVALGDRHPALTLKLYDLSGRVLQSVSLGAEEQQSELQLEGLPQGSYLLQLTDVDGRVAGSYQIRKIR